MGWLIFQTFNNLYQLLSGSLDLGGITINKILMPFGQRKITKHFMAIKTMQRLIQKANS